MNRALLVIDVQNEYFTGKLPIAHPSGALDNVLRAMDAAASAQVPVVVIQHTAPMPDSPVFVRGTAAWELHSEIAKRRADRWVEKHYPGSFTGTALESYLKERQIDTVTILGFMTHMCCDTTSRQAFHRGFKVEFLKDATGTLPLENPVGSVAAEDLHRTVLAVQHRFASVMSTDEWIEKLGSK